MNDSLRKIIFEQLKKKDLDITDEELRTLSKRCLNGCKIYIEQNSINDEEDHILNLKVNYLILKFDQKLIDRVIKDQNLRIKDILNTNIYDINIDLKSNREILLSKVVDTNSYSCSLYKCPRCKAREHTYREVQSRALDEPRSVKCICLVCNMKFGIS